MKIANIIGKVIMLIFGIASVRWIAAMFGVLGMSFYVDDLSNVAVCIVAFIIGLIITLATGKKRRK